MTSWFINLPKQDCRDNKELAGVDVASLGVTGAIEGAVTGTAMIACGTIL